MISRPDDRSDRLTSRPGRDPAETLGYITDIVEELRRLADKSGYRTLGAILAVAQLEARVQRDDMDT
jgi:hypothetical protein